MGPDTRVVLLDRNCVIALANDEQPGVAHLAPLLAAWRRGECKLAVAAITASENQPAGVELSWPDFVALLEQAGLADIEILAPMGYYDVTFWDQALWVDDEMKRLEGQIHAVLAPTRAMEDKSDRKRWLNTKCDVQTIWTHIWHGTDVLVTNDHGIVRKASRLAELGAKVMTAEDFARELDRD